MSRTTEGFASKEVIAVTGVTRRQLAYWRRTGLIVPGEYTAGGHARYSFADLIALKTTKQLLDAGVSVQRLRISIASLARYLPTVSQPLTELSIVATGDVILVLGRGRAFDMLTGQEWLMPVAELARDLSRLPAQRQSPPPPLQGELFEDDQAFDGSRSGRMA